MEAIEWIDSHCHLDLLKEIPLSSLIAQLSTQHIQSIVTIATERDDLAKVFAYSQEYPQVYATQGVHPHEVNGWGEDLFSQMQSHIQNAHGKIVAIGEIGLDYHYHHEDSVRALQQKVFIEQLEFAKQMNLPVVIHSRDADDDMMTILKQHGPQLKRGGVVHSFTSGHELAKVALDVGFFLGFNGIITFKNAQHVRDVLLQTPLSSILLETDAPFLAPTPHRGKENTSLFLPLVAQRVAMEKNISLEELSKVTLKNTKALFAMGN